MHSRGKGISASRSTPNWLKTTALDVLQSKKYYIDAELRDTACVSDIREALASAKSEDTHNYTELVQLLNIQNKSHVDVVAQQETLLKFLSRSVAFLDADHHEQLLIRILGMRIWDHPPNVVYALLDLIISLATTSGKYLNCCLEMLIFNLLSQTRVLNKKMREVLSWVHSALHKISYLVPPAPSKLLDILVNRMPNIYNKGHGLVTYVDTLLKLENSSIGKVVGDRILRVIILRLLDLDIERDDIPQDDSTLGLFDMELEVAVEETMHEGEESLNQNYSKVSELLDKLMVLSFEHLESCQNAGRLDEVFEILFYLFENLILTTCKPKIPQFLLFYACSLDPEDCGVKFASKLLDIFLSSNKDQVIRTNAVDYLASYLSRGKFLPDSFLASILKRLVDYCRTYNVDASSGHPVFFYSGCQAIMYVLCFRMRSILDVPRFHLLLTPLESVLSHKLNPLKECNPYVVSEFLKQAKAGGLFIVSECFTFGDLPESETSRAFGGFFSFDPCLFKISNSFISPNFIYWSMVERIYDEDETFAEVIVYGDTDNDEDYGDDPVLNNDVKKISITPKHSYIRDSWRLSKMPSRIRPPTSPSRS
ncbi:hypothetical protein N665_0159s0014 [Sinapis alba]|nr:hypothetical protein N665_0159s0014 [Sinapis alba]